MERDEVQRAVARMDQAEWDTLLSTVDVGRAVQQARQVQRPVGDGAQRTQMQALTTALGPSTPVQVGDGNSFAYSVLGSMGVLQGGASEADVARAHLLRAGK